MIRPGHVLSMFWLVCSFAKLVLSRHVLAGWFGRFVYRSLVTRPGHVLSMFWLACSFANVVLSRHVFGDVLDDFLQVLGDQAPPCYVDALACLQLPFQPNVGWQSDHESSKVVLIRNASDSAKSTHSHKQTKTKYERCNSR